MMRYNPALTRKLVFGGLAGAALMSRLTQQLRSKSAVTNTGSVNVMGLNFPNRLGIAAGFDRHGILATKFGALGFGHIEIGTLSRYPQLGHNQGIDILNRRKLAPPPANTTVLGINIGLNPGAPDIVNDFKYCFEQVSAHADYVTINLTSPDIKQRLIGQCQILIVELFSELKLLQYRYNQQSSRYIPLVAKIGIQSNVQDLPLVIELAKKYQLDGLLLAINADKQQPSVKHTYWQQPSHQQNVCNLIRHIYTRDHWKCSF